MSRRSASCPNCGAPIEFLWSSAVQTTCPFCRSILVRHDVDLEKVGEVGDLPPSASPIQLQTQGVYRGRPFTVVGRIIYEYGRGGWNEWHVLLDDRESAWLSDAQAEYAMTREIEDAADLPTASAVRVDSTYALAGKVFRVVSLTRARYRGVEGELPFEYWNKREVLFADLEAPGEQFATIDYSDGDDAPTLYVGEWLSFDELQLSNLREIAGW
jgi:uncharacterized protein DUF4178